MTTPRLARAGRSRFFMGIIGLLLMIGFVAIFHSSQQQLDESRQLRLRCEQQQEVLNARMQAIVEHKFRLEKSLEAERKEHIDSRKSLERRAKEEKDLHMKTSQESSIRYESLQQIYKLLQTEHNDLAEECKKTKSVHAAQSQGLERKTHLLQEQLKLVKQDKEREILNWKRKFEEADKEKHRLGELLKSSTKPGYDSNNCKDKVASLEKLISEYKNHCSFHPESTGDHTPSVRNDVVKSAIEKSFNEQVPVSEDLYKISFKLVNRSNKMHELNTLASGDGISIHKIDNGRKDGIINSVENFQIAQKPLVSGEKLNEAKEDNLQQPPPLRAPLKSSTAATHSKTPEKNNGALPYASVASPTPEKLKKPSTAASDKNKDLYKSLMVAPVPENFDTLIKNEEHNQSGNNNNRYANVVDELSGKKDEGEQDNAAREVKDNDFNLGDEKPGSKDHLQDVLDNLNNAAEDDTNNFFDGKFAIRSNNKKRSGEDEDDGELPGGSKHDKADNLLEGDDKLINEVVGDQGKVAFAEGIHLEEAADEDDDDYLNPAARQQEGTAVRN